MTVIALETKVVQSKDVLATSVDSETVMASISNDKYYGLNPISTSIWELLEQPKSLLEVCDSLLESYDVDMETCQNEVLVFVESLVEAQILEIV